MALITTTKCPNCKVTKCKHVGDEALWCMKCGTLWTPRRPTLHDIVDVPELTAPAVPLELPDAEGWWWRRLLLGSEWHCVRVIKGLRQCEIPGVNGRCSLRHADWLPAQPPIVAVREEPTIADRVRQLGDSVRSSYCSTEIGKLAEEAYRIADEIDRKGAK